MKAITLTQPWATLVAIGAKKIETRSWPTKYRGPIAIHAAKAFPGWAKQTCEEYLFQRALGLPDRSEGDLQKWMDAMRDGIKALPLGQVIATARIVNCIETHLIERFVQPFTEQERAFGDYTPGRYGFLLEDVRQIEPAPAKGALGLWEWRA